MDHTSHGRLQQNATENCPKCSQSTSEATNNSSLTWQQEFSKLARFIKQILHRRNNLLKWLRQLQTANMAANKCIPRDTNTKLCCLVMETIKYKRICPGCYSICLANSPTSIESQDKHTTKEVPHINCS